MNYEQFGQELQQNIKEQLGPSSNVCLCQLPVNNGVMRDRLDIKISESTTHSVYLDDCYEAYSEGMKISEITDVVSTLQKQILPQIENYVESLCDFDNVKDKIIYKLMHFQRNKAQLVERPYIPYLDLAIVFDIVLAMKDAKAATIPVNNMLLKQWGVDAQTLLECANCNGPRIFPPALEPLNLILEELFPTRIPVNLEKYIPPLFVLTNTTQYWGAAVILYDGFLKLLADIFGGDFFVIPSSIHETLLFKEGMGLTKESLNEIIPDVNETRVLPQEILSDQVYYYDRNQGKLLMP